MKKLLVVVDMQNDFVFGAFGSEAGAGTTEQNHACALNTMRSCQVIVE